MRSVQLAKMPERIGAQVFRIKALATRCLLPRPRLGPAQGFEIAGVTKGNGQNVYGGKQLLENTL